jgi:hypothetical protein
MKQVERRGSTLVEFQQTTWYYIPEDLTLYNYQYENLRSYKFETKARDSPTMFE